MSAEFDNDKVVTGVRAKLLDLCCKCYVPSCLGEEGKEGEGDEGVMARGIEWARERVRELQHQLKVAKARYKEMGGVIEEGEEEAEEEEEEEEEEEVEEEEEGEERQGKGVTKEYKRCEESVKYHSL